MSWREDDYSRDFWIALKAIPRSVDPITCALQFPSRWLALEDFRSVRTRKKYAQIFHGALNPLLAVDSVWLVGFVRSGALCAG